MTRPFGMPETPKGRKGWKQNSNGKPNNWALNWSPSNSRLHNDPIQRGGVPWKPQAITLKTPSPGVNEFYKKGCQEKSSLSTGGREDFVSSCSATESFHLMFAQGTREAWAQNAQFNLNLSSSPHCE